MSPAEIAGVKAELENALTEGTKRAQAGAEWNPGEKTYDPLGVAWMVTSPSAAAAFVTDSFHTLGDWGKGKVNSLALSENIDMLVELVKLGDLSGIEAMLVSQAVALQTVFANLSQKAAAAKDQRRHDALLMLALKAQSNCRSTLAALVDIKFPRQAIFSRQTNVANGPQQVNYGVQPAPGAVAGTLAAPADQLALPPAQNGKPLPQALPRPVARARTREKVRTAKR